MKVKMMIMDFKKPCRCMPRWIKGTTRFSYVDEKDLHKVDAKPNTFRWLE